MTKQAIQEGNFVRLKSGTEGWIKGQVVEYTDLISFPALGGAIYTGPAYKVYILEGKHKGETIRVPANYVELLGPGKAKRETLYPHEPKKKEPQFPHVPRHAEQTKARIPIKEAKATKYCPKCSKLVGFDGIKYVEHYSWCPNYGFLPATLPQTVPEGTCKKCGKKYYGWALKSPEHRVCECGGEIKITYLPQSLPQTKGREPTRHDVEIGTWTERDRMGIWISDKRTDKAIAEWWDEDAREMFDQGFFKPGDIRQQTITGRAFEESVLDYAESVGILASGGRFLPQTVKEAYYWTAINKDTGEIVESSTPYTSSGRAMRGGRAYASRHWKGTALVEVWRQPHRYSENLKIQPVEKLTLGGVSDA